MFFPKVTYDFEEFLKWSMIDEESFLEDLEDAVIIETIIDLTNEWQALAYNKKSGIIWMEHLSIIALIHEILHIIFWKMKFPLQFHRIIHRIF